MASEEKSLELHQVEDAFGQAIWRHLLVVPLTLLKFWAWFVALSLVMAGVMTLVALLGLSWISPMVALGHHQQLTAIRRGLEVMISLLAVMIAVIWIYRDGHWAVRLAEYWIEGREYE